MTELSNAISKIKEIKKAKGLTNESLAKCADMPKSTLNKMLAGIVKDPSITSIIKLAKALDVSLDSLFGSGPFSTLSDNNMKLDMENRAKVNDAIMNKFLTDNPLFIGVFDCEKMIRIASNIVDVLCHSRLSFAECAGVLNMTRELLEHCDVARAYKNKEIDLCWLRLCSEIQVED